MSKQPRGFTCTRCGAEISLFTPHLSVQFEFLTGQVSAPRHFCDQCTRDPSCAVLFNDVMTQSLKEVRIRKVWG